MNKPINPWKLAQYKAGQNVVCKVLAAEPGGYSVTIVKDNIPGFLPTEHKFRIDEEILAQFVCVANNRVLLKSLYANSTSQSASSYQPSQVSWQDQLNNQAAQTGAAEAGTTPGASEQDRAFAVWAQDKTITFKLKRATDLILPPLESTNQSKFKLSDQGLSTPEEALQWLITDLEGGMRTGCMKAVSDKRLSRSAVLLYKGRAVGCIYGNKTMSDPQPTEPSLQLMLADLVEPDAAVHIYNLPESVTLAMSALFLGYPVERSDDLDARAYMDYICSWLHDKEQTACLAFSLNNNSATCLAFVHKGEYCGSFYVEDQKYSTDINYLYDLIAKDPAARLEASILPPEMTSSSIRFGYSLSMSRPR